MEMTWEHCPSVPTESGGLIERDLGLGCLTVHTPLSIVWMKTLQKSDETEYI